MPSRLEKRRQTLHPERQEADQELSPRSALQRVTNAEHVTQDVLRKRPEVAQTRRGKMTAALLALFISGTEAVAQDMPTPEPERIEANEGELEKGTLTPEEIQAHEEREYEQLVLSMIDHGYDISVETDVIKRNAYITGFSQDAYMQVPEADHTDPVRRDHINTGFEIMLNMDATFVSSDLWTPLEGLQGSIAYTEQQFIKGEQEAKEFTLPSVYIYKEHFENGTRTVSVRNLFTHTDVYTSSFTFNTRADIFSDAYKTWDDSLDDEIAATVEANAEQLEQYFSEQKEGRLPAEVRILEGEPTNESIAAIMADYDKMVVTLKMNESEIESPYSTKRFVITQELLEETGGKPLAITGGYVHSIALERSVPLDSEAGVLLASAPIISTGTDHRQAPYSILRGESDDQIVEQVTYMSPTPFGTGEGGTAYADMSFETTAIGTGYESDFTGSIDRTYELTEYLQQPELKPIATTENGLRIYSTLPQERNSEFEMHFGEIDRGVHRVSTLYNMPLADGVQNVLIINSRYANAHFSPQNPHTIVFRDEKFAAAPESSIYFTSIHETVHLYDHHLGISNDGTIRVTYNRQLDGYNTDSPDPAHILSVIAESNWLPIGYGGHPWDNPLEWVASMQNTLEHPDFDNKIRELTREQQLQYKRGLEDFHNALTRKTDRENPPPIMQLLEQRIAQVAHILHNENPEAPASPDPTMPTD